MNLEAVFISLILAACLRIWVFSPYRVASESMTPTLRSKPDDGDRLLVNRIVFLWSPPKRGDIVVFDTAGLEGMPKRGKAARRVAGLPGEEIDFRDGTVFVDGKALDGDPFSSIGAAVLPETPQPVLIPERHVFVLGDNPSRSMDSRHFGCIPYRDLIGRGEWIYWPPARIKRLGKN
jgi:signal peptidase I